METRELEAMVEPLGRRTEAESGSRRLKAESRDPPDSTPTELGDRQTSGELTPQMVS